MEEPIENQEPPVFSNTVLAERIIMFFLTQIIGGVICYYAFDYKISSIVSTQFSLFSGFMLAIYWFRRYFR
jgi:hypothetical protein